MKKLLLLFVAIISMSGFGFVSTSHALGISIEVGDRPYYLYGNRYWSHGRYWCWVPGHWNHHHTVWIHGHYRSC